MLRSTWSSSGFLSKSSRNLYLNVCWKAYKGVLKQWTNCKAGNILWFPIIYILLISSNQLRKVKTTAVEQRHLLSTSSWLILISHHSICHGKIDKICSLLSLGPKPLNENENETSLFKEDVLIYDTPGCKFVGHQLHTPCIGILISGDFSSKKTESSSATSKAVTM